VEGKGKVAGASTLESTMMGPDTEGALASKRETAVVAMVVAFVVETARTRTAKPAVADTAVAADPVNPEKVYAVRSPTKVQGTSTAPPALGAAIKETS